MGSGLIALLRAARPARNGEQTAETRGRRTEEAFFRPEASDVCGLNEAKLDSDDRGRRPEDRTTIRPLFSVVSSPIRALAMRAIQAGRAISTGQLHALPRFHIRPIDVVVFHGSFEGELVLRLVSRLDAFSGYPFRI